MGDFNLTVILDAVRRAPEGLSRVELAQLVGLSPQTVSNISRRLLDQKLIVEAGKASSGPGKPRTILRLNPSGLYALGVHLDPALTTTVLLNIVGDVVEHSVVPTPPSHAPGEVVAAIATEVERLVDASGVPPEKIAGLGVAAPGPIDAKEGTVVGPPLLKDWHRVPLRDSLAQATGLPVTMDKDVTAAAVAELWTGTPGADSFIFIYLGTGIGCSVVLNNEVVRGVSGNAGEIGHIIVDPDGPPCTCGLRGCVAVACTARDLVARAVESGVLEAAGEGGDLARLEELCRLAEEGNADAARIVDGSAACVAKAASVVASAVDVDRIVFGGPFWNPVSARYLRQVPDHLNRFSVVKGIHGYSVAGTGVGNDVGAVGAACLVLDDALGARAERLLLAR
ncbi:ROK family transcriptional regulator [Paenarthrobacter sp. DKR-5]|uniref:ROK family transcriptional regulator n=1 Tax=Paenarthrobacter sp. DKR-5 TaxID=2835535 RepID=UPI001BDCFD43|nr:ROK family transcriptional regulator [Paenarthrobacter sp. DKR-5]MBT1003855.1 ROK family transcriptional regulator [Paenarthrobacter sp. DKR-5]